jgi:hypothetical protein
MKIENVYDTKFEKSAHDVIFDDTITSMIHVKYGKSR